MTTERDFRLEADQYLAECFANETPPHVNELAERAGLAPIALSRTFKEQQGMRLSDYLKAARVARAQHLLATTDLPTAAIAYAAGFGTRVTFFRAFKRATGVTPDEYRAWALQKM